MQTHGKVSQSCLVVLVYSTGLVLISEVDQQECKSKMRPKSASVYPPTICVHVVLFICAYFLCCTSSGGKLYLCLLATGGPAGLRDSPNMT